MNVRSIPMAGVVLSLLLLGTAPLSAQEGVPEVGWEASAFVGGLDDGPEFGPEEASLFVDPERNPYFGARLARHFSSGLFLEGAVGAVSLQLNDAPGTVQNQVRDLGLSTYSALAGYRVRLHRRIELFGGAGAGLSRWSPDGLDAETDFTLTYGAGTRVLLHESVALRGDVRVHHVPDALSGTRAAVGASSASDTFWGWGTTAGLSFFFGGDGGDDQAEPDRPAEGRERPAEPDAGGEEMAAGEEAPEPAAETTDGDGDGVPDARDRCPNTLSEARVDADGCALDSDGDGVPDGIDREPDTPSGARVDDRGRALDGDGDGVPDGVDECPDTASGAEVNATGCPVEEARRQLEEEGRFTSEAIVFDFDSSRLRSSAEPILDEVGRALERNPDMRIRIEGHTDSIGTEAYNQDLSLRRARSARSYLLDRFPELEADRLQIRGHGETRPLADNGTPEGRQRNRRVEFVVIGG